MSHTFYTLALFIHFDFQQECIDSSLILRTIYICTCIVSILLCILAFTYTYVCMYAHLVRVCVCSSITYLESRQILIKFY